MANLELKKTTLNVADNQLKANDPPCTKDAYADNPYKKKEWDDWNDLVQTGYEYFEEEKEVEGLRCWQQACEIFDSLVKRIPKTDTIYDLMEELDYIYPIENWLQDYEVELGNAGKHGERTAFCQKILETFDWEDEDDSCFRCGIGESLFGEGKVEEACEYFEKWLTDEPKNVDGLNSFSWVLFEKGDREKAYAMVRRVTWGISCGVDNAILFMRAQQLADSVGKENESKWYRQQLDKFEESMEKWEMDEDGFFDEFTMPKQIPVVKEKKIYPNAPCPCGSGKKYKKCCGR